MSETRVRHIERRIGRITEALATIGPMRPGSRTRQYTDREGRRGADWPISDIRARKRHTEPVRPVCVADIRRQRAAYQRVTTRAEQGIAVSIEASTGTRPLAKTGGSA